MNEPTLLERRLSKPKSSFRWRKRLIVDLILMIKPYITQYNYQTDM